MRYYVGVMDGGVRVRDEIVEGVMDGGVIITMKYGDMDER